MLATCVQYEWNSLHRRNGADLDEQLIRRILPCYTPVQGAVDGRQCAWKVDIAQIETEHLLHVVACRLDDGASAAKW